ncbi:uncharacterized protein LOC120262278 [Dioscorea cayenensis subsp. rotundata]|uniref:Uncharacterized protein LOC120262278 n=1 Tax=Dioscorea cayennensis subsp. rotundata TaxID=55577 RepID=A0AB40BI81_DIOCR|nr:uncharacterized protein LOC120262278 [Dioscorea cayenensis subsp. rotundata]
MMDDPIYIEKLQAMKRYRKTSTTSIGLLSKLFQYFLSALAVGLLLSRLCSSLMFLFSMPKYLFIVCNIIIIIFLAGDSKLSKASPAPDIYEEYVKRNQSEMGNVVEDMDEEDQEDHENHEEMDKRFDEFIARVIIQRRNEARMLLFSEGMNIMQ